MAGPATVPHLMARDSTSLFRWRLGLVIAFCPLVLGVSMAVAAMVLAYLTEYEERFFAAVGLSVGGLLVTGVGAVFLVRTRHVWGAAATVLACWLLVIGLGASTLVHRVTYSDNGITVYGLLPVPALDVVINGDGRLGFRDKTHALTAGELASVLDDEVEIVVIGTGWHEQMEVDPTVHALRPSIRIMNTPDAFATFNRLVEAGHRVVLVAHTTC